MFEGDLSLQFVNVPEHIVSNMLNKYKVVLKNNYQ